MPLDDRDLYAVLGVASDASQAQIGHAYRRLVRAHHPDFHPDPDFAALVAAAAAYSILRDPARRAAYDRSRCPARDQRPTPPPPAPRHHRSMPDIRAGPVRWHPNECLRPRSQAAEIAIASRVDRASSVEEAQ